MLGVSLTENSYAIKNVEGYKFWLYGFFIIYFSVALIVHLKNPDQES
jgi:hypothetical protein